MKKYFEQKL